MATFDSAFVEISRGTYSITWTFPTGTMASGDVGNRLDAPHLPDKTVHVRGVTGGTTDMVIEGSMDGTNYIILHGANPGVSSLTFTVTGAAVILENPRYIRPRLNTVSGTKQDAIIVEILAQSLRR